MNKEPTSWITVKGNHIPIFEGQSKEEAIDDFFEKDLKPKLKPLVTAKRYYFNGMEVWASALEGIKKAGRESEFKSQEIPLPEEPEFLDGYPRLKKPENYKQAAERTNPNYKTDKYEWTYNCQRCVVAWEMRYRGYNVTAKPRLSAEDEIVFKQGSSWYECFKDFKFNKLTEYFPGDSAENFALLEHNILHGTPCGARFILSIQWMKHRWQDKASHHAIVAIVNDRHELEYYDPQSGKKAHWKSYARVDETKWCRIDDKELTDLVSNCVYKEGEDKDETSKE